MKSVANVFLFCVCLLTVHAANPSCGGHGTHDTMLVTAAWLAQHRTDPNLVMLAIGQPGDFEAGHIAGSQNFNYRDLSAKKDPADLTLQLHPMADLAKLFSGLGISNDSRIVLYYFTGSQSWVSPATRVFLTLDAMGLGGQTSILDGGTLAWQNAGQSLTKETSTAKPGTLTPCAQDDVIADLDYVKANLRKPGVDLIDARDPEFYTGEKPPNGKRAGHIPGASNITYTTLWDKDDKLLSDDALRAKFTAAGIKTGDRIVSYCHIGQQATVTYFVARYLGYDARLYDGSWEEWSAHTELPAELSKAK